MRSCQVRTGQWFTIIIIDKMGNEIVPGEGRAMVYNNYNRQNGKPLVDVDLLNNGNLFFTADSAERFFSL